MRALLMRELIAISLKPACEPTTSADLAEASSGATPLGQSKHMRNRVRQMQRELRSLSAASMALQPRVISHGPLKLLSFAPHTQSAAAAKKGGGKQKVGGGEQHQRSAGSGAAAAAATAAASKDAAVKDESDAYWEQAEADEEAREEGRAGELVRRQRNSPALRARLQATLDIGVTLIDEEPVEVLHLALQAITIQASTAANENSLRLLCERLQVDSCVPHTRYEVMVAPVPLPPASLAEGPPQTVEISLIQDPRWEPVIYLKYCGAAVQPLRLDIEQNTLTRLLRLFLTLGAEIERVNNAVDRISRDRTSEQSSEQSPVAAEASTAPTVVAEEPPPLELYIRQMHIEPVQLVANISILPLCDEPELQEFHPTNQLHGALQQLTSLQNVSLSLDALEFEDVAEDLDALVHRLGWKYSMEVLQQVHRLLGSLDIVGNPYAIFADVRGAVKTFSRETRQGALKSPSAFAKGVAKGTAGLAGGVGGGVVAGAATMFSAQTRNLVLATTHISMDSQYAHRRQLATQQKASSFRSGLQMGAEALGDGIASGVKGIIAQPLQGAKMGGAAGAVKGMGRGAFGLFLKPVSGVAGFASKVSEGLSSEAKKFTPRAIEAAAAQVTNTLRVRQPRMIVDGILRPYPRRSPLALEVVAEDDEEEEMLVPRM